MRDESDNRESEVVCVFAEPMGGLSAVNASMHYGQEVRPVRPAKKVAFADKMVVPVGGGKEEKTPEPEAPVSRKMSAARLEEAFNEIAGSLQGQNSFYDSAMQGGSYAVVGTMFDAYA